jgi:hypothetical protein
MDNNLTNGNVINLFSYNKDMELKYIEAGNDTKDINENINLSTEGYTLSSETKEKLLELYCDVTISSLNEITAHFNKSTNSIEAFLGRIEEKIDVHDNKSSIAHKELSNKITELEKENAFFRDEVKKVNTPSKLLFYSMLSCFISIISLTISRYYTIDIINPTVSLILLILSVCFYIMGAIMKRQDNSIK